MAYTSYPSVAGTSLVAGGSSIAEEYIPLWVYSSGTAGNSASLAGAQFIPKGTAGTTSSLTSAAKLHTLNSNWSSSQKFAFEASIYTSGNTTYAALWDATTNAIVSGSQISTTAISATLLRSGSFTLTPGHVYALTTWISGTGSGYLTKAHLVALMI